MCIGAMAAPANSVVLAKKNWQLHQRLQEASDNGSGPRAQVVVWDSQVCVCMCVRVHECACVDSIL